MWLDRLQILVYRLGLSLWRKMIVVSSVPVFVSVFFGGVVLGQDVSIKEKIKLLDSSTKTVVLSAIRDLAQIQTGESTEALVRQLKKEKDNYIKIQIIEALAMHQSTVALAGILEALRDNNPYVRQSAVINSGYFIENNEIIATLSDMVDKENDTAVKLSLINTLGLSKSSTAVSGLGKALSKSRDKRVRLFAIDRLEKIGTEEAMKELERHENDKDDEIRGKIREVLRKRKKK